MKNIKKLLALLTVIAISFSALAACGDKKESDEKEETKQESKVDKDEKDDDKDEKADDEELIEETVSGFASCVAALDFNGALEYLSEDYDGYSEIEDMAEIMGDGLGDMLVEQMVASSGMPEDIAEQIGDEIAGDFEKLMDDIMKNMEIEVDNIEIDDDKATVEYVIAAPDFENDMDDILNMSDHKEIFTEATEGEDIKSMSDDEKVDIVIDVMKQWIDSVDTSDIETVEQEGTMELEKVDGDWLILSDEFY